MLQRNRGSQYRCRGEGVEASVFHLPAVTDTKYALRNWLQGKRFVFWDEYSPVEFAELGVMAVTTFKKAFCGQTFEALGS